MAGVGQLDDDSALFRYRFDLDRLLFLCVAVLDADVFIVPRKKHQFFDRLLQLIRPRLIRTQHHKKDVFFLGNCLRFLEDSV